MSLNNNFSKQGKTTSKNWVWMVFFIFILQTSFVSAQESINASGTNAIGSGGLVSYSVGQLVCQTNTGTTVVVSEGVQHPYVISEITELDKNIKSGVSLFAYPNPATDYIILEVENFSSSTFTYQLFDLNGTLLQSRNITDNQTKIGLSNKVPGSYFVKIIENNQEVKTFRVLKSR